jgi:hypothetical protein
LVTERIMPIWFGDLVEQTAAEIDQVGLDLAGDAEDGRVAGVGGGEGGGGVEEAGAGDDEAGADAAGGAGVAVGHVGGGLLVAGVEDADAVLGVVEGVEGAVELDAGEAEDGVDALAFEGGDEGLAAGHRPRRGRTILAGPIRDPLLHLNHEAFSLGHRRGTAARRPARSGLGRGRIVRGGGGDDDRRGEGLTATARARADWMPRPSGLARDGAFLAPCRAERVSRTDRARRLDGAPTSRPVRGKATQR